MGRVRELVGHRKRCPDCWYPLVRGKGVGRFDCPNPAPDCPVIYVKYSKTPPHDRIIKVVRAAVGVGMRADRAKVWLCPLCSNEGVLKKYNKRNLIRHLQACSRSHPSKPRSWERRVRRMRWGDVRVTRPP